MAINSFFNDMNLDKGDAPYLILLLVFLDIFLGKIKLQNLQIKMKVIKKK